MVPYKMDTDLLAWARVVVRNLYEFGRLRLQTALFLRTLEPLEMRDIQMYFYPLWQLGGREYLQLKTPNKTGIMLVQELEALVANPSNLELLSAGVGFEGDLRSEITALVLPAALGGQLDFLQNRLAPGHRAWEGVLIGAVIGGHLELVRLAMAQGSRMKVDSLAMAAAKYGRLAVLQELISQGDIASYSVVSCMELACSNRDLAMLAFLMQRYPDIKDQTYHVLMNAALEVPNQDPALVRLLLDHEPEVDLEDLNWILQKAASNQSVPTLELLLERGASKLDDALVAAARDNTAEVVSFLIERGATDFSRPFMYALAYKRPEVAYLMVRPGVDLNILLGAAAQAGDLEVMRDLVRRGATDFNYALLEGIENPGAVKLLLELGADNFNEGLLAATEFNQLDSSNLLIEAGTDNLDEALLYLLSFMDESRYTLRNVRLLVQRGARNLNQALLEEIEVMLKAQSHPRWSVVRLLIELGANNLDEALALALEKVPPKLNQRGLVTMLVDAGANGGVWPASLPEEEW